MSEVERVEQGDAVAPTPATGRNGKPAQEQVPAQDPPLYIRKGRKWVAQKRKFAFADHSEVMYLKCPRRLKQQVMECAKWRMVHITDYMREVLREAVRKDQRTRLREHKALMKMEAEQEAQRRKNLKCPHGQKIGYQCYPCGGVVTYKEVIDPEAVPGT